MREAIKFYLLPGAWNPSRRPGQGYKYSLGPRSSTRQAILFTTLVYFHSGPTVLHAFYYIMIKSTHFHNNRGLFFLTCAVKKNRWCFARSGLHAKQRWSTLGQRVRRCRHQQSVGEDGSTNRSGTRRSVASEIGVASAVATEEGRRGVVGVGTSIVLLRGEPFNGGDAESLRLPAWSGLGDFLAGSLTIHHLIILDHLKASHQNRALTGSRKLKRKESGRGFLLSDDPIIYNYISSTSIIRFFQEIELSLLHAVSENKAKAKANLSQAMVVGIACDVCKPEDVRKLANFALHELGSVDIWINNAGTNKGFRPLLQFTDDEIEQIISTNLVGSLICTKEAIHLMESQDKGGHIFNMDGAGSGGSSTPLTAVYGSTKCGLRQLQASLLKEYKRSKVGMHTASPGMVLTDLLLSGSTLRNKQMFNIICELPETVARTLVPRMRVVKGSGKAVNYLTPPRILLALVTAWLRRGRWFDEQGRALYAAEADRIRNWAESRARFSFTDAMEMYAENTWVSVFSLSVVCAFIILSSSGNGFPGT
ncbi:hypothetical protein ZIOFF_003913 [Zingiber officinale]|uniref:chlorophyll(ide) b reductase n=1 Tax=Zingiber officinale TaxID=94328 RepID=A0A8J5MAW2_ZINOF|nr:hypothetical protein ZIOFF_003913 [Zingiber officinale]